MMNKTKEIIENLSPDERDDLYRTLWAEHVKEDIESYLADNDEELTPEQIDRIVEMYVYDGEYECNLSYWDNISNLVERVE